MNSKKLCILWVFLSLIIVSGCSMNSPAQTLQGEDQNDDAIPAITNTITNVVVETDEVSTLETIVVSLWLDEVLSWDWPFTVFAPTNEAFEKLLDELDLTFEQLSQEEELLTQIVLYHVLPSETTSENLVNLSPELSLVTVQWEGVDIDTSDWVVVNNATVVTADIQADNWVIHLIDTVLIPENVSKVLSSDQEENENIIVTAVNSQQFPTLVAAIQEADLVTTLSKEWPFTVFAPSEQAFTEALDALWITAEELFNDTPLLTSILTYHLLPWIYSSEDVLGLDQATTFETVQWTTVSISPNNWTPTINGSAITQTDIVASNWVIHVIDAVLLPDNS